MKAQNLDNNTTTTGNSGGITHYAKRCMANRFLLAAAIIISLVTIPLLTSAGPTNEKRTLAGNWMGTVTRVNPPPGQPGTALSLMTFFDDGNILQEGSDPSLRSTGRGTWARIGHQQFTQEFLNW